MADARVVGCYLFNTYRRKFSTDMDEMKMHKLMYFSQRESLMLYDKCLFEEPFYGWKYGPVLKSVRKEYHNNKVPYSDVVVSLDEQEMSLLNAVFDRYASMSSWKLSSLSHAEYSWKRSRNGLKSEDNGDVKMDLKAMKVDAAKEKAYRRQHVV